MSSRFLRGLLPVLVVLGLGVGREARAGRSVDWSEYLEPAGSRPVAKAEPAAQPTKAEPARKKKVNKRAKAESRSKATRQRPARGKARR